MHVTLDTSALVRFVTFDSPEKAKQVHELLLSGTQVQIPDVVFPELEYVLLKSYESSRIEILTLFQFLVSHETISTSPNAKKATLLYEMTDLDMADCFIAVSSFRGELASFDKELLQTPGVTPYWKK